MSDTPIIAAARVDGNGGSPTEGFLSNKGFLSYNRIGPGQYELALAGTPPPDDNCIVNVTINTGFGIDVNAYAFVNAGVVTVWLFSPPPPPGTGFIDGNFYVTVTDNR